MAVNESKLKTGTLTIGGTGSPPIGGSEFACQATNVRLAPTHNDTGDEVETLCGDKLGADTDTSWALQGTSIQDFDDPDGFVMFAFDSNLQTVPFSWQPSATSPTFTGTCNVRAVEIGGDVNVRLSTDFEWPVIDGPDVTPPVVADVEGEAVETEGEYQPA
jgi:hypothetical protein